MTEQPYKISIPQEKIDFLRKKLELATWPDEMKNAGWEHGAPLADVKRLAERWKDGYDWRKFETAMNDELPQFTRDIEIDGFGPINIHYIHQKSKVPRAVPFLFVHGWPGSFLEIRKILHPLVHGAPHYPSFNVVTFSLPGFGFSDAPKKKGFRSKQYAELGHKLMLALGYDQYVAQGGDWGFIITREIAHSYPKHCKAWHTNFPLAPAPRVFQPLAFVSNIFAHVSASEWAGIERTKWYFDKSSGYFKQQSTQPQTLGYGLADSPVALLAWVYEKLVTWSDEYPWEDDEILNWISIYWFSRCGPAASLRIYYEIVQEDADIFTSHVPTTVPLGYSYFPKEIVVLPKRWVRAAGNVVFESDHDSGGHFASWERPIELVADLRKMFGKNGRAYGAVIGKGGYAS
ncbi:alpha/beta-hydrolase [Pluteus cervinus]|uniref:Alpha/beta-hydrolase n=1 Tax=Pluteus cervinus TaxID=181527 RepID=A0ACD3B543_9AGAR|nr:alpha/beta-hydrolase [Pluteus cervinus]